MTSLTVPGPLAARGGAARQVASFAVIGVASTVAYVALYAWFREAMPAGAANAVALVMTAVGNTAANRWLTFGVRGRHGLARDHAAGLLALAAALAITSSGLVLLNAIAPRHGRTTEVAVLVAANAAATLVRFLLLRLVLDRASQTQSSDMRFRLNSRQCDAASPGTLPPPAAGRRRFRQPSRPGATTARATPARATATGERTSAATVTPGATIGATTPDLESVGRAELRFLPIDPRH